MKILVDAPKAIEIAEKFLEKHHETIELKTSILEDTQEGKVWKIIFDVGFLTENIKEVLVDPETGSILGYK